MRWLLASIAFSLATAASAQDAFLRDGVDQWRPEIPGLIFGSRIVIDEQPCCKPGKGKPAVDAPDTEAVARLQDRAFRDGGVLRLQLLSRRTLRITDCDTQSGCTVETSRQHRLVDWWPDKHHYVVNVYSYEDHSAYLIRETDGAVIALAAAPVLSPSGRFGLAWDWSVMNGGPTMHLLDWQPTPPTLRDITQTIACSDRKFVHPGQKPVWLDNTTIAFDDSSSFEDTSARFRMTLEIKGDTMLRWKCH